MAKSSTYARALKKRDELLEAYEALDAQLSSALQQLSWTLALRAPRSTEHASNKSAINSGFASPLAAAACSESQWINPMNANQPDTLHIMVIVGASLNAPKARAVLQLHNFEIRPFGWREDAAEQPTTSNGANGTDDDPEEDGLNELAEQMANTLLTSGIPHNDDEDSESSEGECIETSVVDSSFDFTQDPSAIRAPHDDTHGDDEDNDDAFEEYEVLSVPSSSAEASPFDAVSRASDGSVSIHVAHGPPSTGVKNVILHSENTPETRQPSSPPKHISTSSEVFIRNVERLIHRTLAMPPSAPGGIVAAEDDEELPLSQTTVLIRAPRRFKHASFLPRQTYSKELDEALSQCLSPSPDLDGKVPKSTRRGHALGSKARTEGIRVSCGTAAEEAARCRAGISVGESGGTLDDSYQGLDAEDEMIWWQWTNKLRGIGEELFGY